MQLIEEVDSWKLQVAETLVTVEDLPNEVLFNIFEKLQHEKSVLYNCLFVSKRWYNLAVNHLWYDLTLVLGDEDSQRLIDEYVLPVDMQSSSTEKPVTGATMPRLRSPNCDRVRSVFLRLSGKGAITWVASEQQCLDIGEKIKLFSSVLMACGGIRSLRLELHPFVPLNATDGLREKRAVNNGYMLDLLSLAATRDYQELFLDTAQSRWEYEEGFADPEMMGMYIRILGDKITRLRACEDATRVWWWFTMTPSLQRLEFENVGSSLEEDLTNFWQVIAPLPLEQLQLTGINFPSSVKLYPWQTLRSLRLNMFTNVEATCCIILQSFPSLRILAFNNPDHFGPKYPIPIKEVVCTKLRTLIFTRCQPQKNILSLVAQSCPDLHVCMAPNNTSDDDIITLIDSCPFLNTLCIDNCKELTATAIHYLPRAPRLRSLMYGMQHLVYLDEDCILALAENCPDLHSRRFRIFQMDYKDEKFQRIEMRDKMTGNARFKRWLLRFAVFTGGPPISTISINIDVIRKELQGGGK